MLKVQVVKLVVWRVVLTDYVLEYHRDWDWNQVLHRVWRSDGQVSQTEELCLLGVKINEGPNTVRIRVQHKVDVIVAVDVAAVPLNARLAHDRLLFKNHSFVLQELDAGSLRPFKLRCLVLFSLRLLCLDTDWLYLNVVEVTRFKRYDLAGARLNHHVEIVLLHPQELE